ncbi:hypothetical protein BDV19DRAFT_386266 [Aspergillus venezuelensis]
MVDRTSHAFTDDQRRESEHIDPRSRRGQRAGPSIPERNGPGITPEFRTHHGTSWADLSAEDIHYFDQVIDELREGMRSPSQSIGSAPSFILPSASMSLQPSYSTDQMGESQSLSSRCAEAQINEAFLSLDYIQEESMGRVESVVRTGLSLEHPVVNVPVAQLTRLAPLITQLEPYPLLPSHRG